MALIKARLQKLEAKSSNRGVRCVRTDDPNYEALVAEYQRDGFLVVIINKRIYDENGQLI